MDSSMSMPEYSQAIQKADRIANNFHDAVDRAPEDIKLLIGTAKDIHDILKESEQLIKFGQRPYPGQLNFNRRLDQTYAFIRKYYSPTDFDLSDLRASVSRLPESRIGSLQSLEHRRAKHIHDGLMAEMHKFIQFIFVLALRTNTMPPGFNSLSSLSGKIKAEDSKVADIARRLSEIKYQVERRQIQASQRLPHQSEPDFTDLEAILEQEWRLLCLRAGFEDRAQRPNLPSGTRQLLLSSGQIYNELIINHSRGPLISSNVGIGTLSPISSPIMTPEDFRQRPEPTGAGAIPPQSPEPFQHHQILGDPAIPIQVADIEMKKSRLLKLQSWQFQFNAPMGRFLNWTGTKSVNILTHYFPQETIPYTTHSSLNARDHMFEVTFHGTSRIKWMKEGRTLLDENRENIKYRFYQISDYKQFQEDLRDKYLINTFEFDSLKTNERGWGFVSNQDLKLWCNRDDQTHSLSFFADNIREHLEFPLSWFHPEISTISSRRLVQLTFLKNAGTMEAMLRPYSSLRTFSGSSTSVEIVTPDVLSVATGSISNSPRASISTTSSGASVLGPSRNRVQRLARLADSFQFLKIEFTRDNSAGDDDSKSYAKRAIRMNS
jgi:hypothetical protein